MAAIPLEALVIAAACLFAGTAADAPRFVCKEGVTVERTLEMKGTRTLTQFTERAGDQRQERTDVKRSTVLNFKYVTKDEVRSCSAERVNGFARTYVTLAKGRTESIEAPTGKDVRENPETSELAGKTVAFVWDADKKTYARTIDGAANEALTADLDADMDYRAFLPKADAAVGAKWDVDFALVKAALLRPGGDIPFKPKIEGSARDKRLRKAAWDATGGKITLELGSAREEAGRKLVTISFQGEMSFDASSVPEGGEKGPDRIRIEDAQTLEGKLVWNLDAGRPHSIEWSSKGKLTLTAGGLREKPGGGTMAEEQIQVFSEESTYTGTFTVSSAK